MENIKVISWFMSKGFGFLLCFLVLIACNEAVEESLEKTAEIESEGLTPEELLEPTFKAGDLIFQTSLSAQAKAIQLATHSPFSHMGVVYEQAGQFYVFEAVGPVKLTPIEQWIARGKDDAYSLKRLKRPLEKAEMDKMYQIGQEWMGKSYDLAFDWSDDKLYCSELVWKLYKSATGIILFEYQTRRLRNYH
jgi:hypothetical protein